MSDGQKLSAEAQACLAWFSRLPFFERQGQLITLENLTDGHRLWEALQELNPAYFSGDLPGQAQSAGTLVNNIQNIKHVHKHLYKYIIDVSKNPLPHGPGTIDTRVIAEGYDGEETAKLLKWIFVAASNSVDNHEFMATVMDMSEEHQQALMAIILRFGQETVEIPKEGDKSPQDAQLHEIPMDSDLRNEEVYGKLASENSRLEREKKELQKDLRDLANRINRLQENNNQLVMELRAAQDRAKESAITSDASYRIKDLESKIQDRDDHIAAQEAQISEYDTDKSSLQTENNKLRKANEKLLPMQDQVDELKHERDGLAKKVNALERYRAKVQSVQDVENENRELRRELEDLRDSFKDGDDVKERNIRLQREASELKSLVANTELQVLDVQTRRRQIELENSQLQEQIEAIKSQREQDSELIIELERRVNAASPATGGLDLELAKTEHGDQRRDDDLKAHNTRLAKAAKDSAARLQALQQLLDEERAQRSDLEKRYFDAYTKSLSLEGAVQNFDATEGNQLFRHTKDELDAAKTQAVELGREKDAVNRRLMEAEKTISLVDKNKLEALEALKEHNSADVKEQQARNLALESKVDELTRQLDEHRRMLGHTITKYQGNSPTLPNGSPQYQAEDSANQFQSLLEEITRQREDLMKKSQELQEQEREIEKLQTETRQATEKAAPGLLKSSAQAALKQELENIKRENKLMSTAYFDLSSRLQMNNVSLQRRSEAPRSFLNKQRALVNQATAVRSR